MKVSKWVSWWLFIGLVMIFFQIVLGGITRLTGSGLSITNWDIVIGSLPPLNHKEWQEAFGLYKQTPQFHKINSLMNLESFKHIYFWEFIHRFWARLMGFVFIIPVSIFLIKGMIPNPLKKKLGIVFLLAILVASFGWIMVASGLINRPWVNAYKLSFHLTLAIVLYTYLLWIYLLTLDNWNFPTLGKRAKHFFIILVTIVFIQMFFGGIMSGMKASMYFPSWPDMNGEFFPSLLIDSSSWTYDNFVNYDQNRFMPAWIQFIHRGVAYIIFFLSIVGIYKFRKNPNDNFRLWMVLFFFIVVLQILLGIYVLMGSKGLIPVTLGVFHQINSILLFTSSLVLYFYSIHSKLKS